MKYFWELIESCSKYKKLYFEQKKSYEDLKLWTEKLLESNQELLKAIQE